MGDGRPSEGMWTGIVTSFVGHADRPAAVGEALACHDASVQMAANLFLPADAPDDVIREAAAA